MKNICPILLEKYNDSSKYEKMSDFIYQQRDDNSIRMALSCDLEGGEDTQYPLEDILDEYSVHVTDYFEMDETAKTLSFEVAGSLGDLEMDSANIFEVSKLIGKRVYNKEAGESIELVIE